VNSHLGHRVLGFQNAPAGVLMRDPRTIRRREVFGMKKIKAIQGSGFSLDVSWRRLVSDRLGDYSWPSKETAGLNAGPALAVFAVSPADSENFGGAASGRARAAAESSAA
jgi:hypothetical protein